MLENVEIEESCISPRGWTGSSTARALCQLLLSECVVIMGALPGQGEIGDGGLGGCRRKSYFPETEEKVKHLKRKNAELALIAKRLEERARKLQEANLKVVNAPVAMKGSSLELCKKACAHQRAKDLTEQASALLAKDKQIEALQHECRELQAKITAGKEGPHCLNLLDFDHLLRESQKEVLRLQRQIALKNFKECLQSSKTGSKSSSSIAANCLGPSVTTLDTSINYSSLSKGVQLGEPTLEFELRKKRKKCENLEHEVRKKHKRCKELVSIVESENADLKLQVVLVTKERDSALQKSQGLQTKLENLERVLKHMRDVAERRQHLEAEHKEAQLALQEKQEEVRWLQHAQAEAKREHEGAVQLLEAQVRDLEDQCRSHIEQFSLLSQELKRFQLQAGKTGPLTSTLVTSELPLMPCCSIPQSQCRQWEKGNCCEKLMSLSATVPLFRAVASPYFCSQGPAKLQVFLARYSYNPFNGPNENPESELPLTAGEYIYIYGDMDEDGFFEGTPDAPLDVQAEPGPSAGILVISWLPVTIDAEGSSNGVRVTGYAVYADGQKVIYMQSQAGYWGTEGCGMGILKGRVGMLL
uniref:Peripheral-type benzodiazepine receptor-associated protein 1 n=1 Tax=Gopherus evgoodei TaxID=1825980 RepID=A0A8C4WI51_9SAUR